MFLLSYQVPGSIALAKKEEKGHSDIKKNMTREYTTNIPEHIHGTCTSYTRKTEKLTMKEMETPHVCITHRLNKAVWTKRTGMHPTISGYVYSENIINVEIGQRSSIHWSPMYTSSPSKTCRRTGEQFTNPKTRGLSISSFHPV